MASQLAHRGPDDEGYWRGLEIAFGHRRLSIIDPTGSEQPMAKATAHVCFNGEIFNYRELRSELEAAGHTFTTEGDTEVLLSLYLQHGRDGVSKLDGQFGYAIFDESSRDLWLFRDRLGILPLYYHWDGKTFLFASEIKALLAALPSTPAVDERALKEYLAYRSVPPPHTLFEGIRKLQPGHTLQLTSKGEQRIEPYWKVPVEAADARIVPSEAVSLVASGVERAVKSRMVADVPIGAFLSGGIDSSLVVAVMSKLAENNRVETFSAGFDDPRFDELPYAREVSTQLRTEHHEVIVRPADFEGMWPKLTWHRDAPISEPADIAIFQLASLARKSVKVLLSGEGADELFAGYPKYRFARWAGLSSLLPAPLRCPLFRFLERSTPEKHSRARTMFRAMSAASEGDRFQTWFAPFTAYERDALIAGEERASHMDLWRAAGGDVIQRMLFVDCHTWLSDNLLERGDRMAMAASVESRPPFLDHNLVELAFRLPSSVKVRNGKGKWVLKEVARGFLPDKIVDRKKVGFRVPLDAWFREGLREFAGDLLLSSNSFVSEVFDRSVIDALLQDHLTGRRNEELRIWTLMCLEVWHDVHYRDGERSRHP